MTGEGGVQARGKAVSRPKIFCLVGVVLWRQKGDHNTFIGSPLNGNDKNLSSFSFSLFFLSSSLTTKGKKPQFHLNFLALRCCGGPPSQNL